MKPTILVVDDSPTFRRLVRFFLSGLPLEVVEAEDGLRALGYARVGNVALVVADLEMPNLDGMGLLRALRASENEALRRVPLVLLTMQTDPEVARQALAAGANKFLSKPVKPDALQQVVRELLGLP